MASIKNRVDDLGCITTEIADPNVCFASTLVTFDFALKERYVDKKVENLTLAERPLLGMLEKDEEFTGDGQPVPIIHGNPQGIAGSSLSVAQTNTSNAVGKKFVLTAGDYFGTVDIGEKVLRASRNNPGAFLQNKSVETDGLYEQMADNLSLYCFGNGGGSSGKRASVSGNVITLTTPQDAVNFEIDMSIVASANDGSDSAHTVRSGSTKVTVVDRVNGKVTVASAAAISGFADNDFLFREGDFKGNTSVFIIVGLGGFIWADDTPPALYSLTRTADIQRLAGSRVPSADLTGKGNEERIQLLGAYMTGRYKGPGFDAGFMHPEDWQNLSISLQSRGTRPLKDESTRFGYMALEVVAGGKLAKIYPDKHCPKGVFFGLRMKNWTLYSMLKLLGPQNADGLTMLRKSTTTDYEFRIVSFPCLATNAPGYSGRVALAA